jgi:hypothetical protein
MEIRRQGAVASTLKIFRNGAVGFFDLLDALDDLLQSVDKRDQHEWDHPNEDEKSDPMRCRWHEGEFESDRLRREKAVDTEDAKCNSEQCEEDENDPRTRKIVTALDADQTRPLGAIRRIANQQGSAAE